MQTHFVYQSEKDKPGIWQEVKELVRYRFLLRLMIKNNLVTRYKRSALGVVWTVLNPLLMMAVLTLAFSLIFGRKPGYPVYVLSGTILWNFFTQTTVASSNSLAWGGGLMKRIYFPRSTFVVAKTGSGLVNMGYTLLPLFIIMLLTHVPITPALLFLPVSILITAVFVLGVSFFMSAVAVFFTDVVDLYQVILRALFYLTPVMYPESILPEGVAAMIKLNPMYSFINIFRYPIYEGALPPWDLVLISSGFAVAAFFLGGYYFVRKANQIAYRL